MGPPFSWKGEDFVRTAGGKEGFDLIPTVRLGRNSLFLPAAPPPRLAERLCLSVDILSYSSWVEAAPQPARRSLGKNRSWDRRRPGKAEPFRKSARQSRKSQTDKT